MKKLILFLSLIILCSCTTQRGFYVRQHNKPVTKTSTYKFKQLKKKEANWRKKCKFKK